MQVTSTQNSPVSNGVSKQTSDRPVRREFYKTVVIKNNGATVAEADWKSVASGSTPREVRKQLKNAGMQSVRVFDAEGYKTARAEYKDGLKTEAKAARESVIAEAFQATGLEIHPRLSSALRTMLPMYKGVPSNKTIAAFKNVIKAVASSADMSVNTPTAAEPAIH